MHAPMRCHKFVCTAHMCVRHAGLVHVAITIHANLCMKGKMSEVEYHNHPCCIMYLHYRNTKEEDDVKDGKTF